MVKKTGIPSEEEIRRLPRWAIVAFAARCARRIQPLFQMAWPQASLSHVEAVEQAIRLAETSATLTITNSSNSTYARVLGTALDANRADAADAAYAAAYAFKAANAAAYTFKAADAATYAAAYAAVAYAFSREIRRDFDRLVKAVKRDGWTDKTPVPPEFFGPVWPNGEPDWARLIKSQKQPKHVEAIPEGIATEEGLCIQLHIDDDSGPEDQVVVEVIGLIHALNQYHIALGGNGLAIEDFQTLVQQDVSVGVGR